MKKLQIKLGLIAASLTIANWLIINFLIIEVHFFKYLMMEGIWAISYYIYKNEQKKI
jgi:hypothetical protein